MALNKNQKLALIGGGVLLLAIFGKRIFQSKGAKTGQAGIGGWNRKKISEGERYEYEIPARLVNYLVNGNEDGLTERDKRIAYPFFEKLYDETGNQLGYFSQSDDLGIGDEMVVKVVVEGEEKPYLPAWNPYDNEGE